MTSKIWFITGASRGFGYLWAKAALERGDRVAATARNLSDLDDLRVFGDQFLPLQLDVCDREAVFAAVHSTHQTFGRLDVVVSNAGYGHFGYIEELTEPEIRRQFETNVFGSMSVIAAVLPIMRAQGSGHILQISSVAGLIGIAGMGVYNASKFALEGYCEALSLEVAPFGVHVTLIEPAGFATDFFSGSASRSEPLPAYTEAREKRALMAKKLAVGDPKATSEAIFQIVDSPNPPPRLLLGIAALQTVETIYAKRLENWRAWSELTKKAHGSAWNINENA